MHISRRAAGNDMMRTESQTIVRRRASKLGGNGSG
jgi:hypothetical protein